MADVEDRRRRADAADAKLAERESHAIEQRRALDAEKRALDEAKAEVEAREAEARMAVKLAGDDARAARMRMQEDERQLKRALEDQVRVRK